MSIQRKVKQFAPLVESGYFEHSVVRQSPVGIAQDGKWITVTTDHHVTIRIDIARLAAMLAEKAISRKSGRAYACCGYVRVSINTTKERQ